MPESTFLQIQGGDASTTRMIELSPGPVRIGRGPQCEVQLDDPGLSDVHCMLRLRGATWHFQPVGPAGQVWIDDQAADQQRPIPLGVPFRVGSHWLILRPADSATNDWVGSDAPVSVELGPDPEPEPQSTVSTPTPTPTPTPAPAPTPVLASDETGTNEERLKRWEARLEQRERWLKGRQEERRWEARWKSAGETIRAKATPPVPAPASRPTEPPRTPTAPPRPSPSPSPRPSLRPSQTPPVARIIEPRGSEPFRRVADPAARPTASRIVERPLPDPPAPIRRPTPPASPVRAEARPVPPERRRPTSARPEISQIPTSPALIALAPTPIPMPTPIEEQPVSGAIDSTVEAEPVLPIVWRGFRPRNPRVRPSDPIPVPDTPATPTKDEGDQTPVPETVASDPAFSPLAPGDKSELTGLGSPVAEPSTLDSPRTGTALEEEEGDRRPSLIESANWLDETLPIAIEEARRAEIAPLAAPPEIARPGLVEPAPVDDLAVEASPSGRDWPSAQAIFAAQGCRAVPEPRAASKTARRQATQPEPTEVLTPPCWSISRWLGWFPTFVVAALVGAGGIGLAFEWAIEANNANMAIRLATRPAGVPGSTIDPALIPRGGWWTSTAPHQAAWALALVRAEDGEDHSAEISHLLDSSRNASRLASRSRYVVEVPEATAPGATSDLAHLGRTRDVVTLVWTGRRLRKEGKLDPAIRAYRSALELASKASLGDLEPPAFFEDAQVRRYALPRESLLGYAARSMAEEGEWTAEQWTEALPPSATASLVASRVFAGMRKRADADRLADLAIRQSEAPSPSGFDPAEDRAAGAEALAYRGRWTDAAEQYRRAIDQTEDDATRRMWWLNLAEVAQRMNDDAGRARAIEAAKSPDSVDDITRRALKYQQSLPGLGSSRPRP